MLCSMKLLIEKLLDDERFKSMDNVFSYFIDY